MDTLQLKYVDKQAVIDLAKMLGETDVIDFLHDHGDPVYYHDSLIKREQRKGQAFFNSLDFVWQDLLSGTPEDPFNTNDDYSVALAIAWLTAQEIANQSNKK